MMAQAETLLDEAVKAATAMPSTALGCMRIVILIFIIVVITIVTVIIPILVIIVAILNITIGRVGAVKNLWILTRNVGPTIPATSATIVPTAAPRSHSKPRPVSGGKTGLREGYTVEAEMVVMVVGFSTGS